MTGVYIMRTESDNDTFQAQHQFMAAPKPLPPQAGQFITLDFSNKKLVSSNPGMPHQIFFETLPVLLLLFEHMHVNRNRI